MIIFSLNLKIILIQYTFSNIKNHKNKNQLLHKHKFKIYYILSIIHYNVKKNILVILSSYP